MRDFGFNGMSDEEFRREFIKFLTQYQFGLEDFMKKTYESKNFMSDPFTFSIENLNDNYLKNIFRSLNNEGMDIENGEDESGSWEKRSWTSPDGNSSFSSYSRNSYYNPFNGKVDFNKNDNEIDTIKLLESKLNKAIMDEKYEDAAKIRDLINSLKKDSE